MGVEMKVDVKLTPQEVAILFCDMNGEDQADFFSAIADISAEWPGAGWCNQSYDIAESVDDKARGVIEKLAEHVLSYDPYAGVE